MVDGPPNGSISQRTRHRSSRLLRENVALLATLGAFGLALMRALVAARLDPETTLVILRAATPVMVIASGLMVVLPTLGMLPVGLLPLWMLFSGGKASPSHVVAAAIGMIATALFVPLLATTLLLLFTAFTARLAWRLGSDSEITSASMDASRGVLVSLSFTALLFPACYVALADQPWMPVEQLGTAHGQMTGFVVDDDGEWSDIVLEKSRAVVRLRTAHIYTREICSNNVGSLTLPPVLDVLENSVLQLLGVLPTEAIHPPCYPEMHGKDAADRAPDS